MLVRVKDGISYGRAGRYPAGTVLEVSEAEMTAFGDKFYLVPEGAEKDAVKATAAAIEMALEHAVKLEDIQTGTGKDGKITVGDVREHLNILRLE